LNCERASKCRNYASDKNGDCVEGPVYVHMKIEELDSFVFNRGINIQETPFFTAEPKCFLSNSDRKDLFKRECNDNPTKYMWVLSSGKKILVPMFDLKSTDTLERDTERR
jgi:hypothetical protein